MGAIAALDLVVFVVVVAFVYASITQVLIPIFQDKPLFPFFRQRRLERELREAREREDEARLKKEIVDAQRRARDVNRPRPAKVVDHSTRSEL